MAFVTLLNDVNAFLSNSVRWGLSMDHRAVARRQVPWGAGKNDEGVLHGPQFSAFNHCR